jgi:hypothetical protein
MTAEALDQPTSEYIGEQREVAWLRNPIIGLSLGPCNRAGLPVLTLPVVSLVHYTNCQQIRIRGRNTRITNIRKICYRTPIQIDIHKRRELGRLRRTCLLPYVFRSASMRSISGVPRPLELSAWVVFSWVCAGPTCEITTISVNCIAKKREEGIIYENSWPKERGAGTCISFEKLGS